MLVSDLELYNARDRFIKPESSRHPLLDKDEPASLHLLVRLPGAENIGDSVLVAVLHLKEHHPTKQIPMKPGSDDRPTTLHSTPITWLEVERKSITPGAGADFTDFLWNFLNDRRYQICVHLMLKDNMGTETIVGQAETELKHIIESDVERLQVDLTSSLPSVVGRTAEFALEWCKQLDDSMLLEVRVKIQRKVGWPFSVTRPFFVLYRWEPKDNSWTPLYRSEILTKVTDTPDAKGSMCFKIAVVKLKQANNGQDERPLRLEFFHYKTSESPKMLGYLPTSVLALRQAKIGGKLNLELSSFPEGDLAGQLVMSHKRITATRCLFTLQAEFGGDIVGDFVYFNMLLSLTGNAAQITGKRFSVIRPYFVISRYNQQGDLERIYHSETSLRVFKNKSHKYKHAKLTKKKLNGGSDRRSLSIQFFHDRMGGDPVELGHIATSISALVEMSPGSTFPLSAPEFHGYVRLEQFEETPSTLYFLMHCVIGDSIPETSFSSDTEEFAHERTEEKNAANREHRMIPQAGSLGNSVEVSAVERTIENIDGIVT